MWTMRLQLRAFQSFVYKNAIMSAAASSQQWVHQDNLKAHKLFIYFALKMSREQLAVQRARKSFQTGKTKPLEYRIHQLKSLLRFISERRSDIAAAVKKDLGKVGLAQLVSVWMFVGSPDFPALLHHFSLLIGELSWNEYTLRYYNSKKEKIYRVLLELFFQCCANVKLSKENTGEHVEKRSFCSKVCCVSFSLAPAHIRFKQHNHTLCTEY